MLKALKDIIEKITRYESLVIEYEKAADNVSSPAKAYINWGVSIASTGDFIEAIEKFKASITISPNEPEGYTNWGVALAKMGNYEEAIEKFKLAAKVNPEFAQVYVLWGAALAELGKLNEAEKKYERAVELAPSNSDAYVNWGVALARQNKFEQATSKFKSALLINPNLFQAYFLWGAVIAEQGNYSDSIEKFETTIRLNPSHADAYHFWGVALNKMSKYQESVEKSALAIQFNPMKAESYINCGDALSNLGQYDQAIANYQKAIEINPNLIDAYVSWGITFNRKCESSQAVEMFKKAIEIKPEAVNANFYLASTLADMGRFVESIELYKRVYEMSPGFFDNLINYGIALHRLNKNEEALQKFFEARAINEKSVPVNFFIASIKSEMGQFKESLAYFDNVLEVDTNHIDTYINYALALSQLERNEQAVNKMRACLRVAAENPHVNFVYGIILSKDEKFIKDAIDKFKKAIELAPQHIDAYLALGESLLKIKRPSEATKAFSKVFELAPELPGGIFMLGVSYAESARMLEANPEHEQKVRLLYDKAVECYHLTLEKDSNHLEAHANIAYLAAKLGNYDSFISQFNALLEKYPEKEALVQLYWGQAYDQLKMTEEAKAKFELAVQIDQAVSKFVPEGY